MIKRSALLDHVHFLKINFHGLYSPSLERIKNQITSAPRHVMEFISQNLILIHYQQGGGLIRRPSTLLTLGIRVIFDGERDEGGFSQEPEISGEDLEKEVKEKDEEEEEERRRGGGGGEKKGRTEGKQSKDGEYAQRRELAWKLENLKKKNRKKNMVESYGNKI